MNMEMVADIIICVASTLSFIYGVFTILMREKALYLKMVVLAMACIMISRGNIMLQYFTTGREIQGFHVGLLGLIGCFLFLLSSNYGEMDRLADDGSPEFMKYRVLSWIAPLVLLGIYCPVFFTNGSQSRIVINSAVMFFLLIAARFHMKHLIFPDVEYGIVRNIRGYNAVALLLCLAMTVLLVADIINNSYMFFGAGIVIAACCLIILPLLRKEVAKWTTI